MKFRYVYQLIHTKIVSLQDDIVDQKELGLYSSKAYAYKAQERYIVLLGFCDLQDGFCILKRRVNIDANIDQLSPGMPIYSLKNEYALDGCDLVTDFGYFTNLEQANSIITQLATKKYRTKKYLGVTANYTIGEFILDADNPYWSEGFKDNWTD